MYWIDEIFFISRWLILILTYLQKKHQKKTYAFHQPPNMDQICRRRGGHGTLSVLGLGVSHGFLDGPTHHQEDGGDRHQSGDLGASATLLVG